MLCEENAPAQFSAIGEMAASCAGRSIKAWASRSQRPAVGEVARVQDLYPCVVLAMNGRHITWTTRLHCVGR